MSLKVGVGLYMRHSRRVQETVARVKEGAIGPIVMMSCYFNLAGLHDTPPRPADMTKTEQAVISVCFVTERSLQSESSKGASWHPGIGALGLFVSTTTMLV